MKKKWTQKEEDFLFENWGVFNISFIATSLKRSKGAVRCKASRMGLGSAAENSEKIHLAEVCRLVHRNKNTLKTTWVRRGLVITKLGRYSMIDQVNLAKVMKNNPEIWDATECDSYFEYYDWFWEKRKADRKKKFDKRWEGYVS